MTTQRLFDIEPTPRKYHDSIMASVNTKGCMDVDTVKGCTPGMNAKEGGCYGECYAAKIATRYGIDRTITGGGRWPAANPVGTPPIPLVRGTPGNGSQPSGTRPGR